MGRHFTSIFHTQHLHLHQVFTFVQLCYSCSSVLKRKPHFLVCQVSFTLKLPFIIGFTFKMLDALLFPISYPKIYNWVIVFVPIFIHFISQCLTNRRHRLMLHKRKWRLLTSQTFQLTTPHHHNPNHEGTSTFIMYHSKPAGNSVCSLGNTATIIRICCVVSRSTTD